MIEAVTVLRCWWSPSGWATQSPNGGCSCRPCAEDGAKLHPKIVYDSERRIKRILRKQGIDYGDDE